MADCYIYSVLLRVSVLFVKIRKRVFSLRSNGHFPGEHGLAGVY